MTAFKQAARRQQATWRANQQFEAGEQPKGHPNGSTLADEVGRSHGNFLSDGIKRAVRRRAATKQKWQTFDETRLRNNLLSSMPMCFNLFGELDGNPDRLTTAGAALFGTTAPGDRIEFEWSPGRVDPAYTGDRTAFDVALFFGNPTIGGQTFIGIETKYHEHAVKEKAPDVTTRMPRYREITERATAERNAFKPDRESRIVGTALQQVWRDHLLLLALLQHPSGQFAGGRYVPGLSRGQHLVRGAGRYLHHRAGRPVDPPGGHRRRADRRRRPSPAGHPRGVRGPVSVVSDLQQAAATARSLLARVAADGGVLLQIETGERTPRDGDWEDAVAVVEALAERPLSIAS